MDYPLADLPEDEEYNQYNDQPSPSSSTQDDYYAASDADNYNNPRRRKQLVLAGLSLILVVMLVLPLAVVLWAPLLRPAGISLLQRLAGILRFIVMTSAISAGIISTSNNGSHKSDDVRKLEGAKRDSVSGKWGRNSIRSGALDMPAKGDQVSRSNAEKGKGILASRDDDANHDDKARAWRDLKMKAAEEDIDSSSGGDHQGAGYGGGEIEAIEIKEPNSPQSSSSNSLRRFQKIDTMEIKEAYVRPEVSAPSMDELWRRNMRAGTSADRINALKREDAGAPRRTIHKQRSLEGAFVSPLKPQNNNILYSNAAGSLHHRSSAFPNQAATATMTAINQPVRAHSGNKANVASGGGNSVQDQKLGPKPVTNHDKAKDQRLGPNPVINYDKAASSHYSVVKDQRLGPSPVTKVASSHHNTNANMSINKHHQHVLLSSKKHSRSDDNLHKVASSSPSSPSSSSRPQSLAPSSSTIRSRRQRGTSVSYDFGADYGPEWLYDLDPLPSPESIFVAGFNRSPQHNHASSSLSAASASSSASSMQNSRPTASQPLIEATEAQSLVPWRVAGSQPIDIVRPRNASQHNAASAPLEDASNDGDDQVSPISAPSLKKRADDFIAKFNEQLMKQKRESLERRREWSMMHGGQPPP